MYENAAFWLLYEIRNHRALKIRQNLFFSFLFSICRSAASPILSLLKKISFRPRKRFCGDVHQNNSIHN